MRRHLAYREGANQAMEDFFSLGVEGDRNFFPYQGVWLDGEIFGREDGGLKTERLGNDLVGREPGQ